MTTTHNLGFPRIGKKRELKFALEAYWKGDITADALLTQGQQLRRRNWWFQSELDYVPVGDFSFYDHVLDMSFLLGHVPDRVRETPGEDIDRYFRVARGRSAGDSDERAVRAGEMTKWFDTNYHYIVPEVTADTTFSLNAADLLEHIGEADALHVRPKPVLIGPLTYLWLAKARDGSDRLALLERLLPVYEELLELLAEQHIDWVQLDEPALVTDLAEDWRRAFGNAYRRLAGRGIRLMVATYFGGLGDNLELACALPADGLHLDAVSAPEEIDRAIELLPADKTLSLGVVDGRNVWKTDLGAALDRLEPVARKLGDRLWIAPSCSLLHVPVDLAGERTLDTEVKRWLAFALQKLEEVAVLAAALDHGRDSMAEALADNAEAIASRRNSTRVHDPAVKRRAAETGKQPGRRGNPYAVRAPRQHERLRLPLYPTTTIGSFPQTTEIRQARRKYRNGELDEGAYRETMKREIARSVREQEALGLDVIVHGEAERNDMVEYFGEQLEGFAFTRRGWVQSYGSRCVKPPILFGDVKRPAPMTVDWISYAQSLTDKPVKGMLTGPVTMLNWSFVRDDQPRRESCLQLALAIREEVLDLERAGIGIVQIDEAALREGLPLRRSRWREYLDWAVAAFGIAAGGVRDETQIHTHMCYSEFNDIMDAIAALDADVITIETSRSDMELLDAFDAFDYPNEIGPGVYDIHSPNTPSREQIVALMHKAARRIPADRLWVNPDCGLKTRHWEEVVPALKNMVAAARELRSGGNL